MTSRRFAAAALSVWLGTLCATAGPAEPTLEEVLRRMGAYVAAYGQQASLLVATERYTQTVRTETGLFRPRQLVAEFALVRTGDEGRWTGMRDVVEVDGQPVTDREDRLVALLTASPTRLSEARRIADESARFNVGPVIRNFNVPTTALQFLDAANHPRFVFTRRGEKTVDGVGTWEIAFREVARPTLVGTRAGKDVACEGVVWVVPADGTIVRTRLSLRGFADVLALGDAPGPLSSGRSSGEQNVPIASPGTAPPPATATPAPPAPGAGTQPDTGTPPSTGAPPGGTGGPPAAGAAGPGTAQGPARTTAGDPGVNRRTIPDVALAPSLERLESDATIEVAYRRDERFGMWLPSKMSETYSGAIPRHGRAPILGEARTIATYSDYRRFETSARIVEPGTPR